MTVAPHVKEKADRVAHTILEHLKEYQAVEEKTGVPWHWIACVHYRESDLNFRTHLANGDPLTHKTRHVPRGLIAGANPPYTWSQAAMAALEHQGLHHIKGWDTFGRYAFEMEAYNGWGYRRHGVTSPYLWSQSNEHLRGKYVRDGVYSASAVDEQMGGLIVLNSLIHFDGAPAIKFGDADHPSPIPVASPLPWWKRLFGIH